MEMSGISINGKFQQEIVESNTLSTKYWYSKGIVIQLDDDWIRGKAERKIKLSL
jgi:hypothetical protein